MEFDFSVNQSLEDISVVPEAYRGAYAQGADGVYTIAEGSKGLVDAISGLGKALKISRANERKAPNIQAILGQIGEDFDSPEAVKAKLEELQGQVAAAAGGKVNLEKMKADMEKAFSAKEQGYQAAQQKMQGSLAKYLVDASATAALAAEKGNATLLMPHVRGKVKVVEDGDDYVVRVLDDAGDFRGDGKGGFMTIADLVKEMKGAKEFSAAFESETATGGGAKPRTMNNGGQGQRRDPNQPVSANDRIKAGLRARGRG